MAGSAGFALWRSDFCVSQVVKMCDQKDISSVVLQDWAKIEYVITMSQSAQSVFGTQLDSRPLRAAFCRIPSSWFLVRLGMGPFEMWLPLAKFKFGGAPLLRE